MHFSPIYLWVTDRNLGKAGLTSVDPWDSTRSIWALGSEHCSQRLFDTLIQFCRKLRNFHEDFAQIHSNKRVGGQLCMASIHIQNQMDFTYRPYNGSNLPYVSISSIYSQICFSPFLRLILGFFHELWWFPPCPILAIFSSDESAFALVSFNKSSANLWNVMDFASWGTL